MFGFWVWHGFDLVDEIEMGSLHQSCWPLVWLVLDLVDLVKVKWVFSILMLALGFTCHVLLKIHVQQQNAN
jgi:hypothetical protein